MTLRDAIDFFTREKGVMACMSIACGDARSAHTAAGSQAGGDGLPVGEDSIFDLASLTKLLTGLTVMRLHEEGLLDLTAPVTRYAPQFSALTQVTVDQVLGFERALVTPQRVDTQADRAAGLSMLYAITPGDNGAGRAYSDMHAMVLKYVIEGAAGERYMDAVARRILRPLDMRDTFCRVPDELRGRCVSCDGEHRIEGGRYIVRSGVLPGTPHDPKARLLNPDGDDCPGHAGLFSTRGDMVRLCQGVLGEKVVSASSLRAMARNRTGHALPDGSWTQFLGSQCYVRHPVQYHSEIPVYMSDNAIGLSGFTGHHLSIDPEKGIFVLYLGNRVYHRLSVLVPEKGRSITDYGLSPDGTGFVVWPDGTRVPSSAGYVHLKDKHFHAAAAQVLFPEERG